MGRIGRINKEVKKLDRLLFCEPSHHGHLEIFRKGYAFQAYSLGDDVTLHTIVDKPHFVLALTHDWSRSGERVEWGLEPIMHRLKSIDSYRDDSLPNLRRMQNERVKQSRQRAFSNETEAFVKDWRGAFKEATKDINTSNLSKIDSRRKKGA